MRNLIIGASVAASIATTTCPTVVEMARENSANQTLRVDKEANLKKALELAKTLRSQVETKTTPLKCSYDDGGYFFCTPKPIETVWLRHNKSNDTIQFQDSKSISTLYRFRETGPCVIDTIYRSGNLVQQYFEYTAEECNQIREAAMIALGYDEKAKEIGEAFLNFPNN